MYHQWEKCRIYSKEKRIIILVFANQTEEKLTEIFVGEKLFAADILIVVVKRVIFMLEKNGNYKI